MPGSNGEVLYTAHGLNTRTYPAGLDALLRPYRAVPTFAETIILKLWRAGSITLDEARAAAKAYGLSIPELYRDPDGCQG